MEEQEEQLIGGQNSVIEENDVQGDNEESRENRKKGHRQTAPCWVLIEAYEEGGKRKYWCKVVYLNGTVCEYASLTLSAPNTPQFFCVELTLPSHSLAPSRNPPHQKLPPLTGKKLPGRETTTTTWARQLQLIATCGLKIRRGEGAKLWRFIWPGSGSVILEERQLDLVVRILKMLKLNADLPVTTSFGQIGQMNAETNKTLKLKLVLSLEKEQHRQWIALMPAGGLTLLSITQEAPGSISLALDPWTSSNCLSSTLLPSTTLM
ncbi:hypothetical protein BDK51DRAFT_28070 [Blyttiomyces helicus]|uniref:Uncharacterized protein n=1 Tax=Blyttiomyces helicus TaxID=388810 RepID=A0A4P9W2Z5_9FUNG|nr:hypothetical protein BDK51DRAFT_28070 [Blyttiomyces helicus]|eukprot:RKO86132.1 hypothetical protein BDK51DRAFT_28070 [Blyttiomyces helicus]